MAVKHTMGVVEILQAWEGGLLSRGAVPERLMAIIDEENVDEVIASLSQEVRELFIETATIHYSGGEMISLRPELEEGPLPPKALAAVQGWLRRHGGRHDSEG